MSTIASPVSEIEKLRFEPFPASKAVAVTKAVRHDRVVLAVGGNGTIYTQSVSEHAFYSFGKWPFTDGVINALYRAGVITHKAKAQHLKLAGERDARRSRSYHAAQIRDHAKALGIRLTKSQLEKIAAETPELPAERETA